MTVYQRVPGPLGITAVMPPAVPGTNGDSRRRSPQITSLSYRDIPDAGRNRPGVKPGAMRQDEALGVDVRRIR